MPLVPVPDSPTYGGVKWYRCTACGRYVDESKAGGGCPHCNGKGLKEPITGARRGPVISGQKTYLPVQREELIEALKQEFLPGNYEKFIAAADRLSEDRKWTLLHDLRFPHPQGWSHYSNRSLLPLVYSTAQPRSRRETRRFQRVLERLHDERPFRQEVETFQKMRKRLRDKFAPLLPEQYRDTRVTEYVYEEPPTILVGDTVTDFQNFEELLIAASEGFREPRRDLAAFARDNQQAEHQPPE